MDISRCIRGYFDEDVEVETWPVFCEELTHKPSVMEEFIREGMLHSQLHDLVSQEYLMQPWKSQSGVAVAIQAPGPGAPLNTEPTAMVATTGPTPSPVQRGSSATMSAAAHWLWTWLPRLTLTAVVVAGAVYVGGRLRHHPPVGQLNRVEGHLWLGSERIRAGALLSAGQHLKLSRGIAQITLVSGVEVVLSGPTDLRTVSQDRIQLEVGELTARVPAEARGFTVTTPDARIVDMGTEFNVTIAAGGPTELHVFSGMVEVNYHAKTSPVGTDLPSSSLRTLRVTQGRAVRLDRQSGSVAIVPLNVLKWREMPTRRQVLTDG